MNDLISRQDAIKCCRNEWEEEVEERLRLLPSAETKITLESAIDYLNSIDWLPEHDRIITESTKRKSTESLRKGKWIEEDDYEYGENVWRCSVCGEPYILIEGTPKQNQYYFCPNCGCKMER